MKKFIKVSAALLAAALLTGNMSGQVWAGCGHHTKSTHTTGYAACWQDGVCLEEGSCDVDGVCIYGGSCMGCGENGGGAGRSHHGHRQSHHH